MFIQLPHGISVLKEHWDKLHPNKKLEKLEKISAAIKRTGSCTQLQKLAAKVNSFYRNEISHLQEQALRFMDKFSTQLPGRSPLRWSFSIQPIEIKPAGLFRHLKSLYIFLFNCIWLKIRIPQFLNVCAKVWRQIEDRATGYEAHCHLVLKHVPASVKEFTCAFDLDRERHIKSIKDKIDCLLKLRPATLRSRLVCRKFAKRPSKSRFSDLPSPTCSRNLRENGRKIAVFFSVWGISGAKMERLAKTIALSPKVRCKSAKTQRNPSRRRRLNSG